MSITNSTVIQRCNRLVLHPGWWWHLMQKQWLEAHCCRRRCHLLILPVTCIISKTMIFSKKGPTDFQQSKADLEPLQESYKVQGRWAEWEIEGENLPLAPFWHLRPSLCLRQCRRILSYSPTHCYTTLVIHDVCSLQKQWIMLYTGD